MAEITRADREVLDEQEYDRLMGLDWTYGRYADPVEEGAQSHRMTFGAYVAQDGDLLVIRWYSAQPAPAFDKLPPSVDTVRYKMFLFPHYQCFRWLTGASAKLLIGEKA